MLMILARSMYMDKPENTHILFFYTVIRCCSDPQIAAPYVRKKRNEEFTSSLNGIEW